jgi:flagellar biosynthetic protein FlhB
MPGDRTEQATQHRREKARSQGDILQSRELSSAAGTLAGVLCLGLAGRKLIDSFRFVFTAALSNSSPGQWELSTVQPTLSGIIRVLVTATIPAGIAISAIPMASALAGILQTGGLRISGTALGFRFDRVNPIANVRNLCSLRSASRLGKSLLPAAVLAVFAVQRIARELSNPPFALSRIEMLGSDVYGLFLAAASVLFAWALIDYLVEWRSRESRLMMSREELKEEFKETEGNPQIRSRIRGLQRQFRRRKVKSDVAKAAVVLTNPTHYAVALGFDFAAMDAPKVLAKGRNLFAEEIKAEARWAGVPIVENPPLARSLYRSVEIGQAIPANLYAAVATILAYLYRQRVEEEMRERRREAASRATRVPEGPDAGDRLNRHFSTDQAGRARPKPEVDRNGENR